MASAVPINVTRPRLECKPANRAGLPTVAQRSCGHSLAILFACFVGVMSPAGGAPSDGSASRTCLLVADRVLTGRLAVWQQRLKLDDWKISLMMVHRSDLDPNPVGNVRWHDTEKSAIIRVLDASESQSPCRDALDDMEIT